MLILVREEFVVWYMIATRVATLFWVSRMTRFSWSNYCTCELQYDDTRATTFVAARHCRARKPQLPPTALSRAQLSVPRVNWITGHASIESPSGSKMLPRAPRQQSPCAPDLRSTDGPKELRRARQNHGCSDSFSFAQPRSSFYNCVGEIFYHNHGENLYHGAADIICGMWFFSSDQLQPENNKYNHNIVTSRFRDQ